MTKVFTLFPTADQDPALRRSTRPISRAQREDAAARRRVRREHATDKAIGRASKAAANAHAGKVDRVTLRKLLQDWQDELEAYDPVNRDALLRLLEGVASEPQQPRALYAYRKLTIARASARRAAGLKPTSARGDLQ